MNAKNNKLSDSGRKRIGLIVNPVAGMGGVVGLKGTDGEAILQKAKSLGAKPVAFKRAEIFLSELNLAADKIWVLAGAGEMGEDEARKCGFKYTRIGENKEKTNAEDTRLIASNIRDAKVDVLVFCGGDGTARDILEAVGTSVPTIGVPTGVKMHSAVFAVDPRAAAQITLRYLSQELPLREGEVMDVDEEAFREGRVSAELFGYLLTPYEPHLVQESKMASPITESELRNQAAVAIYMIENMKPNVLYIIGPGTTTRTIGDLLDVKKTLLGVDLFLNKRMIARDVNEKQILDALPGREAVIIVTPIGGQGFILGRGNQQISPRVIREVGFKNIIVVATEGKMRSLRSIRVDTGDPELDVAIREQKVRVITDYKVSHLIRVE